MADTSKDYYERLSVPRTATPQQIKKAYHKKARECHPDRGGNKEQFVALDEAYKTLSDPTARRQYDQRQIARPYLTPDKITWTVDEGSSPEPVTVRLSYGGGSESVIEFGPERMVGDFWAISNDSKSIMTGDDLYDFLIVPASSELLGIGTHRDEVKFFIDDQAVSLPIIVKVLRKTTPPPPRPESRPVPPPTKLSPEEPSPPAAVPPRPSATVARFLSNLFIKVGILAAALAFAAAPFGIMHIWAPIFNHNQQNIVVDFVGLGLGIGCLAWLCAGVVAVLGALGNLLSDW